MEWDVATVINPKKNCDKGTIREIVSKHPEINELLAGGLTEGRIEYFVKTTNTKTRKKETENTQYLQISMMI
ncbi:unnamed protein product [Acanthoscelides obtectus]|uniref:Uncharacterized protein n=1 Tax=Acanthoscelides obtectus TaxID=200917 RepID=A0A9P0M9G8_ACAOB|nr:unnamed protein product [Acanthoscelides obtectus]CAK1633584.1 hypothetical protein AOBTE_LOCUS8238 [Acanthoscelides obtectus]